MGGSSLRRWGQGLLMGIEEAVLACPPVAQKLGWLSYDQGEIGSGWCSAREVGLACPQHPGWNGGSMELRENASAWKSWQKVSETQRGTDQRHSTF